MIDPADVKAAMAQFLQLPIERMEDSALLAELVHESFILVQLVIELQERFDARLVQEDLQGVQTVGDLVRQIVAHEIPD